MKLYDIVSKAQYMQVITTLMNTLRDGIGLTLKQDLGFMELKHKNIRISTFGSLRDIQKVRDKKWQ